MSKKRLHKSSNAVIGGVCGGLAEYYNVDATLVRILVVAVTLAGLGLPAVLYVICLLVFSPDPAAKEGYVDARAETTQPPCEELFARVAAQTCGNAASKECGHESAAATKGSKDEDKGRFGGSGPLPTVTAFATAARSHPSMVPIVGVALIGIGIMALLCNLVHISLWRFWPLVLVVAGLVGLFTPASKGWSLERAGTAISIIAVGLALLAWMLQIIHLRVIVVAFFDLWPAFLIVAGLAIIGAAQRSSLFTLASSLVFSAIVIFGLWVYGGLDLASFGSTPFVMDDAGFSELLFDVGFER